MDGRYWHGNPKTNMLLRAKNDRESVVATTLAGNVIPGKYRGFVRVAFIVEHTSGQRTSISTRPSNNADFRATLFPTTHAIALAQFPFPTIPIRFIPVTGGKFLHGFRVDGRAHDMVEHIMRDNQLTKTVFTFLPKEAMWLLVDALRFECFRPSKNLTKRSKWRIHHIHRGLGVSGSSRNSLIISAKAITQSHCTICLHNIIHVLFYYMGVDSKKV
jgi:hypothetical protein